MKKKKLPLPKYYTGGEFLEDAGNAYKNAGLGTADAIMSTVGLSNVIKDDAYQGAGSKFARGYSSVVGQVGKTALPMAANIIAPGSGKAVSAVQGAIGQFNPENVDEFGNPIAANPNAQKMNGIASVANAAMPMMMRNGGVMQYMNGGMNAEVEKEENTLNPDGSTNQYNGPSHAEGGIKTSLKPGTMIFSDRLKLGGKTFADLNKANNTAKEDKMLEESKSARVRLTAELMKSAKNKNSEKLFEEQEALKQSKLANYAKRIGIAGDNKYTDGGYVGWSKERQAAGWKPLPANYPGNVPGKEQYYDPKYTLAIDPETKTYNNLPLEAIQGYQKPVRQSTIDFKTPPQWIPAEQTTYQGQPAGSFRSSTDPDPNARYVYAGGTYVKVLSNGGRMPKYEGGGYGPNYQALDYTDPSSRNIVDRTREMGMPDNRIDAMSNTPMMDDANSGSPNWAGIATQIGLGLANNVGNIYDLSRANKTETTTYNRVTPTTLSAEADLATNRRMYADAKIAAREGSGGSGNAYLQLAAAGRQAKRDMDLDTNTRYGNANAQILNQGQYYNAGIGDKETDANAANRAASRNIKSSAYANIGQNVMGQYGDYKRGAIDQQKINMLGQYYADPNFQRMVEEYKKANKYT